MTLDITRKRRPYVHTKVYRQDDRPPLTPEYAELYKHYGLSRGPSSGVELRLTREGVEVSGWYDSHVGIESFVVPWDVFDAEREALK